MGLIDEHLPAAFVEEEEEELGEGGGDEGAEGGQ